jgi:hypothetical protein
VILLFVLGLATTQRIVILFTGSDHRASDTTCFGDP